MVRFFFINRTALTLTTKATTTKQGPLLRAVNQVAKAIETEFPHVEVDTLAYQYTRPAPKITKPRDNVIIRLCSIECNFAVSFSDESNKAFRDDMINWSKISNRIWIWNYVTDFGNYVMPWPDYRAISQNVRFFANHSVKGLYQEANYQSYGGDCAELKTYLMSSIMWYVVTRSSLFSTLSHTHKHTNIFFSKIYQGSISQRNRDRD